MEGGNRTIARVFEQREREFLLSAVRVTMQSSLEEMEIGDTMLKATKEGEMLELPRWVAEELVQLKLAEMQEEAFEVEIFKALTREKILPSPQLSTLEANFYMRMKRRLATIKTGVDEGKYRREDFEKLKATCYNLIGRRLSKLLAVSSSASLQTIADRITPEESVFFVTSRAISDEWKQALLGE